MARCVIGGFDSRPPPLTYAPSASAPSTTLGLYEEDRGSAGLGRRLGRTLPGRPLRGRRRFWRCLTGVSRVLRGRERASRLLVLAGRRFVPGQPERTLLLILAAGRRVLLSRRVLRGRERITARRILRRILRLPQLLSRRVMAGVWARTSDAGSV